MNYKIIPLIACIALSLYALDCGEKTPPVSKGDSTAAANPSTVYVPPAEKPKDLEPMSQSTMMKFVFTKGEKFSYHMRTITDVSETTDSVVQSSMQDLAFTYSFEVLGTDPDGTGRLSAECSHVQFKGKYGNREMSYDSSSPKDKAQEKTFAQYSAVLRNPFEIEVSAEGTIISIKNVDRIIEKIAGSDYKSMKLEARKQIAEDFANNTLKNQLQIVFQKLSDKPVANDSSWTIEWEGNLGFLQVKNTALYTLQGVKTDASGSMAHIGIAMKTQYIGPKKMDTGQGMATIQALDAKGTGSTVFDLTKHRTKKRSMDQKLLTRLVVDPPQELKAQMPNIGLIKISQDASIKTTVVEVQ